MTKPFMHPDFAPSETSAKLAFAGGRLDRLSEERDENCLNSALADPTARAMGFARGRVLLSFETDETGVAVMTKDALEPFAPKWDRAVLMGFAETAPRLAVPLGINPDDEDFSLPEHFKAVDFRSLALQGLLDHETLGMVAHGGSLIAWHSTHRFCARCGNETESRIGGVKRSCPSCEKDHFPRTDPVVIMLTTKGEKCLLGRSHHFPTGMYSALAGFVEPGESLESAVRRETFEESGIRIGDVRYHASQPWPFPHTLMIGCYGEALDSEINMDAIELDDCRWFTRDEVRDILAGGGPKNDDGTPKFFMPPKMAIANRLVADWVKDG
ncbi:NAD(+) diphosphatase [Pseudahrensia aquimaris]|uniref:NAD(+) diphosphatase n=1 Tax=Pseudahrensia aquimaris TaxID=744461 RepID=A0ABW3FH50_9HYPH